jgi:hypothetical protein
MELKRYTTKDYFGQHIDNYYSINQNIDRKLTEHATSAKDAEINFQFRNPDYLIFNVEPIN